VTNKHVHHSPVCVSVYRLYSLNYALALYQRSLGEEVRDLRTMLLLLISQTVALCCSR